MRRWLGGLLILLAACSRPRSAAPVEARRAEVRAGFHGTLTPRSATALHAPPNVFRMKGWNSRSTWIKLIDIVADGSRIEEGKEIARFEFGNEEALPWIKKRVTETNAYLESTRAAMADEARVLGAAAELAVFHARADDWRSSIERYHAYERRTHVLAPHAGLVRDGYLNHLRRKVQKTDDMPCGTPFAFVAADERLSVEFLVPEHRIRALSLGQTACSPRATTAPRARPRAR